MIPVPNALALLLFFERPGFVASLRLCPPAAREEAYTFSNAIFSGSEIFWSAELIAFSAASATCPGLTVNPNFWDAEFAAFSEALPTPFTTADCNCLPMAEFATFLRFSFVACSMIFFPIVELIFFS